MGVVRGKIFYPKLALNTLSVNFPLLERPDGSWYNPATKESFRAISLMEALELEGLSYLIPDDYTEKK
jgi:hypothetical protein